MEERIKYAIGERDFKALRESGAVYVDKTKYIETLINKGSCYSFFGRPQGFGKSLFLSTLRYFFEGRRELFKGLKIDSSDWNWESYPVLYFDLNSVDCDSFNNVVDKLFKEWEAKYEVTNVSDSISLRFQDILRAAHKKTGRKVVILVDEYDKHLSGVLTKDESIDRYWEKLRSIYINFKYSQEHIKFVFLTGVCRLITLSIFSDANNVNDLSDNYAFTELGGFTENELQDDLKSGIASLANEYGISIEEVCCLLKNKYGGYKYDARSEEVFHPLSVLKAMSEMKIANYWHECVKPNFIAKAVKEGGIDIKENLECGFLIDRFGGINPRSCEGLLYYTGYLTKKEYDREYDVLTLGVPNKEVQESINEELTYTSE